MYKMYVNLSNFLHYVTLYTEFFLLLIYEVLSCNSSVSWHALVRTISNPCKRTAELNHTCRLPSCMPEMPNSHRASIHRMRRMLLYWHSRIVINTESIHWPTGQTILSGTACYQQLPTVGRHSTNRDRQVRCPDSTVMLAAQTVWRRNIQDLRQEELMLALPANTPFKDWSSNEISV